MQASSPSLSPEGILPFDSAPAVSAAPLVVGQTEEASELNFGCKQMPGVNNKCEPIHIYVLVSYTKWNLSFENNFTRLFLLQMKPLTKVDSHNKL